MAAQRKTGYRKQRGFKSSSITGAPTGRRFRHLYRWRKRAEDPDAAERVARRRQAFLAPAPPLHRVSVEALKRPLPKPTEAAYVEARLIEALTEARLALEFLERGITRNAAGKAFQAWEALLAALLRLEKLKAAAKSG